MYMYIASYPVYHFWHWIAHIFEDFFFIPFADLRHFQDQSWWGANTVNWVIVITIFALAVYWLVKLNIFHNEDIKNNVPDNYR